MTMFTGHHSPFILDCDPGEDDALAILYALQRKLPLKALVCGFGNTSPENTLRNGAGLLALAGRADVPLFQGALKPYRPHPVEKESVDAGAFVGANGLCGVSLPDDHGIVAENISLPAEERLPALAEFIRAGGPMTYIVTGPCSTLAHLIELLGNDARSLITKVIVMGGALDAAGNHGPINPDTGKSYAEFNFYCDPHGVDAVLRSHIPVTIVPWDLTERIVMGYAELQDFKCENEIGLFVLTLMKNFLESYGIANDRSFEFNDCINLIAYEGRETYVQEKLRIVLEGEQSGRLIRDNQNGTKVEFFGLHEADILPARNSILSALGVNQGKD